jgi:hypothetical protein
LGSFSDEHTDIILVVDQASLYSPQFRGTTIGADLGP